MGVLGGIRVLDLSQFLSGPRAAQILAEHGADVIKIERPPIGETSRLIALPFDAEATLSFVNVNKRGLKLDLKSDEGKKIFLKLVERSDVVIENLSPGTMEKMGLGYENLIKINPKLVYARISGFGSTGQRMNELAFDLIAQATAGIMDAYSMEDKPPGIFFADLVSGAYCALGIMLALWNREKSGRGQKVDISMQDVMYYHNQQALWSQALGKSKKEEIEGYVRRPFEKIITDPENPTPFWNSYKVSDGYVVIVALTDRQWEGLMRAIGREELLRDERFSSLIERVKLENSRDAVMMIERWTSNKSAEEVMDNLKRHGVPCGRVHNAESLEKDEQLIDRGMIAKVMHPRLGEIRVAGIPIKLSETPGEIESPCPDIGQHSEEILREVLKMSDEEIKRLREEEII
jgi:CoA:oxalate CoA-transferase